MKSIASESNPLLSLDEIVTSGLCMGCGLCQSLAGPETIEVVMTPEGRERPLACSPLSDRVLEVINATCPGVQVGSAAPELLPEGIEIDPIWGGATQMYKKRRKSS